MSSIITVYEGNVGINKTNPIYPLDISGSAKVSTIVDISNSTGISNQILISTGSGLSWKSLPTIGGQAYWLFQTTNQLLTNITGAQILFKGTGQPNTLALPQGLYDIEISFAINSMTANSRSMNYYTQILNGTANGAFMYSANYNDVGVVSPLTYYTDVMGGTSDINTSVFLLGGSNAQNSKAFIKGSIYVVPTIPGGTVRITPYIDFMGNSLSVPGPFAIIRNGSYFLAKYISADYSNTAGGGTII